MKKRKLFLNALALLSLCVTGCHKNNSMETPSINDKTSASIVNNDTSRAINTFSEDKTSSNDATILQITDRPVLLVTIILLNPIHIHGVNGKQ